MSIDAMVRTSLAWLAWMCAWSCMPGCQAYAPLGAMDLEQLHFSLDGQARLDIPQVESPVWVIFAIDCSGSMAGRDPTGPDGLPGRARAIRNFLDQHADRPDMRWGVIRFGAWPAILTQRDTDGDGLADRFLEPDGPRLRASLDNLAEARGWTDYTEALDLATTALRGGLR